ncbi:hypothetical protein GCM10009696_20710 [Kocuria himachalensis]
MQLYTLRKRMFFAEKPIWVTDDTPQSRSLLRGEEVIQLPYAAPRNVSAVLKNGLLLHRILDGVSVDQFVSTGAGVALSCAVSAARRRVSLVYIESATRVSGLSLTGRVLSPLPYVRRYVQYPHLANSRWQYEFSVFDDFSVESSERIAAVERLKIFVTVGANKHYGFRRLVDAVARSAPKNAEVFVQYGPTGMAGIEFDGSSSMSSSEMDDRIKWADTVVAHAGTGSALSALKLGKLPVLVPRSSARGEHVDEHQHDLSSFLAKKGLAVEKEAEDLRVDDLWFAASKRVLTRTSASIIAL